MLARHLERADREQQAHAEAGQESGLAARLRAFIRSGFRDKSDSRRLSAALLAAGAADPKLLSPVRDWHERHYQDYAASARHPLRVLVLLLAMDGLWLNDLLGTMPLDRGQKEGLLDAMLELADQVV